MWELLWIIGFTWIVIFCCLPETSRDVGYSLISRITLMHAQHILLKRAKRLRKITDNLRLRSASEIKQK